MNRDEEWNKVVTYWQIPHDDWLQRPLHVMRNGKCIINSKYKRYIFEVDLENDTIEQSLNYMAEGMYLPMRRKCVDIETFVSPNRYMK